MKNVSRVICLIIAIFSVLPLFSCAADVSEPLPELTDYAQIPGITEDEIAAVKNIQANYDSFTVSMLPSGTELFYDETGEFKGFSVLMCRWFTDIFEIQFIPRFYDWPETISGIADHSIDFTGELTATPERRENMFMTDTIGERTIKAIRYNTTKPVWESTAENPIRCCFLRGTTAYDLAEPFIADVEVIFAESLAEVMSLFDERAIDCFITDGSTEAMFDTYEGVVADDFSPVIYSPVSLTTQNPELAPIIGLVQKIIESGYNQHFSDMYKQGYTDYLHHKLLLHLTTEERAFLDTHVQQGLDIPYITEFDNYPISFYNEREATWQGVSYDILTEISNLTGLTFTPAITPGVAWTEMLPMLRSGEALMAGELVFTRERAGSYIWAAEPYMTDSFALISKAEFPDASMASIPNTNIGLLKDSAYAEFFHERFPGHRSVTEYDTIYDAVDAMERGEIDLLMATKNLFLTITNYLEKPAFKTNLVFMHSSNSYFGFNKEQELLCSIVSKAQRYVDTRTVADRWQRMVFDYNSAIAKARIPLWIGLIVLVLLIISLLIILVIRSRRVSSLLETTVTERTKALEIQTNTNRAILDSNPFCSVMFDEDINILDCNLSAQRFFEITDTKDSGKAFLTTLSDMIPAYQPSGRKSLSFYDYLKVTVENGFCEFETTFVKQGKPLYFNIIMKKIAYYHKSAIVAYMFDLTAQKEVQNDLEYHASMLEALGSVAHLLLMTDVKDLTKTMYAALDLIGRAASVDRAYIWKNHTDENGAHFSSQLYEWSIDRTPNDELELFENVSVDGEIAYWHEALRRGKSISLLVRETAPNEQALFKKRGVVSVLMVPIFMQDTCWGFIGFDDCHKERVFSEAEVNILRICGFMTMVITDTIQNEVATHLLAEREAALISAQIKTNFLANMSHEIRTPMNAIQGMTELIMHEDINETVLAHATDIRNACRGLLLIINDILDISKIESGKLEIVPARYHISSLLMDVISIIKTRSDKKTITFLVNIDPKIPCELIGDEQRIKQVLINLLNNAVKFTNEGQITLSVSCILEENKCNLTFSVADTGIGIKDEDIEKIFVLFQQINTKKNRNIEGTGLGLSISKQLAEMMGGSLEMTSEYGKGSTFVLSISQPVSDPHPLASLKNPERNSVLIYESRRPYLDSVTYTLDSLGCNYKICSNRAEMQSLLDEFQYDYLFISSLSVNKVQDIAAKKQPDAVIVVLNGDGNTYYKGNVTSIAMPIHCLQLANILNDEYVSYDARLSASHTANIIAPNAKVLVVDDNVVNLKVAAGLLNIYKIQADTASGGMQAVAMVRETSYDVIFMDHMMPDMDGIDTTVAIRNMGEKYASLPIVALTANAIGGMRDMFKAEGLNDFLPKPIEMSKLDSILKKWLPKDKQQVRAIEVVTDEVQFEIPGIDTHKGIQNSGGKLDDYNDILTIYTSDCESRLAEMARYYHVGDTRNLAICVHAIKSASANVGADDLSDMAAELETACKVDDIVYIDANLRRFTDSLGALLTDLRVYLNGISKKDVDCSKVADPGFLKSALDKITAHMDGLDIDAAEQVLVELYAYHWDDDIFEYIAKINHSIGVFDYDGIEAAVNDLKTMCGFDTP